MMSKQQLADLLRSLNVAEVASESGLSVKTIYRLRHMQHSPTLDTVQRILDAAQRLSDKAAEAA